MRYIIHGYIDSHEFARRRKVSLRRVQRYADKVPGAVQMAGRLWLFPEAEAAHFKFPSPGRPPANGQKVSQKKGKKKGN